MLIRKLNKVRIQKKDNVINLSEASDTYMTFSYQEGLNGNSSISGRFKMMQDTVVHDLHRYSAINFNRGAFIFL